MEKEEMNVLANVLMALSTFIGVGGAMMGYLSQVLKADTTTIILIEIIYVILTLLILSWIKSGMNKKQK